MLFRKKGEEAADHETEYPAHKGAEGSNDAQDKNNPDDHKERILAKGPSEE